MSAAAILKLQASGFSSDQVSALAELLDTQVATKADIEASEHRLEVKIGGLKADLEAAEHRLDLKIGAVKSDLETKTGALRADLEGVEHRLELKIADLKAMFQADSAETKSEIRVMRWMIGFTLAFQLAIFAKLFFH